MTNTRLTDPEVLESRYPVRLIRFEIRRGSGGIGRYHGGDGVVREMEFLRPLRVSVLAQRRTTRPYGLAGGGEGLPGRTLLSRATGAGGTVDAKAIGTHRTTEALPSIATVHAGAGDRLIIETPGGGGYGRPDQHV